MQRYTRITLLVLAGSFVLGAAAPSDPSFGIIGGSFGQTMRVVLSALPPDPCSATVGFHTSDSAPPVPDRTFNLTGGQTAFADVDLSKLTGRFGVRVELRPVVHVLGGSCAAAVEVFEVFTGRTTIYQFPPPCRAAVDSNLPPPCIPPPCRVLVDSLLAPPCIPGFAPVGVAPAQVLRLAVARDEGAVPPPCRGALSFADAQGNPIGGSQAFDLAPGQIAFLDINPSRLGTAFAPGRTTLQPRLSAGLSTNLGGTGMEGCRASIQVYDQFLGWSTEFALGQ